MFGRLWDIMSGREKAWDGKFGSYYGLLRTRAQNFLARSTLTLQKVDSPVPVSITHDGLRLAIAYNILIPYAEMIMKSMIMGRNDAPVLNVDMKGLNSFYASNAIVAQLAGFVLISTDDDDRKKHRSLLWLMLSQNCGSMSALGEMQRLISNLSVPESSVVLYAELKKHLGIQRRQFEFEEPFEALWLTEQIYIYRNTMFDKMLNLSDEEVEGALGVQ